MSLRVSVFGMTTCGKRVALWNRFIANHRRVIIVDSLGEWIESSVQGFRVDGLSETLEALEQVAFDPEGRWRIIACIDEKEIGALTRVLIPPKAYQNSPVLSLGGMALYIPEVDQQIAPHVYDRTRDLWRRGRHVNLSVYADTQSISSCSKETVKNVDALGMMATTHSTDLEVLEGEIRDRGLFERARDWSLKRYHLALWWTRARELQLVKPCPPKLRP